jgi:hypothetical protein
MRRPSRTLAQATTSRRRTLSDRVRTRSRPRAPAIAHGPVLAPAFAPALAPVLAPALAPALAPVLAPALAPATPLSRGALRARGSLPRSAQQDPRSSRAAEPVRAPGPRRLHSSTSTSSRRAAEPPRGRAMRRPPRLASQPPWPPPPPHAAPPRPSDGSLVPSQKLALATRAPWQCEAVLAAGGSLAARWPRRGEAALQLTMLCPCLW